MGPAHLDWLLAGLHDDQHPDGRVETDSVPVEAGRRRLGLRVDPERLRVESRDHRREVERPGVGLRADGRRSVVFQTERLLTSGGESEEAGEEVSTGGDGEEVGQALNDFYRPLLVTES